MTVYVFKYVLSSVCIFMQNAAATCNHQGCINYPGPHHFCNGTDSPYISYDLLWDIWGVSIPSYGIYRYKLQYLEKYLNTVVEVLVTRLPMSLISDRR